MSLSDANPAKGATPIDPAQVGGAELAPTFANRFYILVNQQTTRIAFGEFVAGDPNIDTRYHTAIVVPTENALQLAHLIIALHTQNLSQNKPGTGDGRK